MAIPYSRLARLLHWVALQPQAVRRLSFDLERRSLGAVAPSTRPERPVYVCGLARSGTTLLLQLLHGTGAFASASYRDMPFVLAPQLWRRLRGPAAPVTAAAERAHGDGLLVDLDSVEAFEEVFWRTASAEPADLPELLQAFADYRRIVTRAAGLRHDAATPLRYLSKNNNNLERLELLLHEPQAQVLLACREPLATATSLWRMHQRFQQMQAADSFVGHYMRWLGHHEFGAGHRPPASLRRRLDPALQSTAPDYWLGLWCAAHEALQDLTDPRIRLVQHEWLRATAAPLLQQLLGWLQVTGDTQALAQAVRTATPPPDAATTTASRFDPALVRRAQHLHGVLLVHPLSLRADAHSISSAMTER
ncbi:MAG: sulfotransferase [Rubrivivax sp.]